MRSPSAYSLEIQLQERRELSTSSSSSSNGGRFVVLRTFKEWGAVLPLKTIKKLPAYFKRINDVQQRRLKLVGYNCRFLNFWSVIVCFIIQENSYKEILNDNQSATSEMLKSKLDLFLATGTHTNTFLGKENTGDWILNDVLLYRYYFIYCGVRWSGIQETA